MEINFKCFGTAIEAPLPIDGDWVRIQCGVDGNPNYIFGLEGVKAFYDAGAGVYTRENGKPKDSLAYWISWYQNEKKDRIETYNAINRVKNLLASKT